MSTKDSLLNQAGIFSLPRFGRHKFCISQWAENKDLRRRDRIIPNRRIFPREFPWTGFKQAGSGRSKPGIYTHPRVKSHGASATYTILFLPGK